MRPGPNSSSIPLILILLFPLFTGCQDDKNSETHSSQESETWTLVFEDEFEDLSGWNIWTGGAFNNEIQMYTGEQLSLDSGILTIHALRKNITGPSKPFDSTSVDFEYVSGRIESKETYGPSNEEGEQAYRFMARIKLPAGHGMWPAFWSYGDPWPTHGEIDILEARGAEPTRFSSNIYYGVEDGININHDTEAKHDIGLDLTEEFHKYEMIWSADSIEILFDGERIHRYTSSSNNNINNLVGKKQKLVFNTAVGGWFFADQNSANYADSSSMEIDWVRVYRK